MEKKASHIQSQILELLEYWKIFQEKLSKVKNKIPRPINVLIIIGQGQTPFLWFENWEDCHELPVSHLYINLVTSHFHYNQNKDEESQAASPTAALRSS